MALSEKKIFTYFSMPKPFVNKSFGFF